MLRQANNSQAVVDELLDSYLSWREECAALELAYERWIRAAEADRALAFAVYSAQLDLEEHAARCYEDKIRAATPEAESEQLPLAA
jgi:hypothetical protein